LSTLWSRNFPKNMHELCSPPSARHESTCIWCSLLWCIHDFFLCLQWQVYFCYNYSLYYKLSTYQGRKPPVTC
jgi:hypothetical protein